MNEQSNPQAENGSTELPEPKKGDDSARSTTGEELKDKNAPHKGNPDSEGLGCWENERFVVGYIDEVNGPGAVEVPGFKVTRHEAIQLAKYWAGVEIDLDFSYFVDGQTGSTEIRLGPFASRRIARIAEALGEEEVATAVNEAYEEFGKGIDLRTWKIFREGTPEERQALQDEMAREMSGTEDPEAVAKITEFLGSLGVDYLAAESGKASRFALLRSPAAAVSDPACIIFPVVHYLNVDPNDGRYRKNDDGSVAPIEWEIRILGVSPLEMKRIQRLPDAGQAADSVDIVMMRPGTGSSREFYRISNKARWTLNPELSLEVGKAAVEASNVLAAKLAGRNGVTMFAQIANGNQVSGAVLDGHAEQPLAQDEFTNLPFKNWLVLD